MSKTPLSMKDVDKERLHPSKTNDTESLKYQQKLTDELLSAQPSKTVLATLEDQIKSGNVANTQLILNATGPNRSKSYKADQYSPPKLSAAELRQAYSTAIEATKTAAAAPSSPEKQLKLTYMLNMCDNLATAAKINPQEHTKAITALSKGVGQNTSGLAQTQQASGSQYQNIYHGQNYQQAQGAPKLKPYPQQGPYQQSPQQYPPQGYQQGPPQYQGQQQQYPPQQQHAHGENYQKAHAAKHGTHQQLQAYPTPQFHQQGPYQQQIVQGQKPTYYPPQGPYQQQTGQQQYQTQGQQQTGQQYSAHGENYQKAHAAKHGTHQQLQAYPTPQFHQQQAPGQHYPPQGGYQQQYGQQYSAQPGYQQQQVNIPKPRGFFGEFAHKTMSSAWRIAATVGTLLLATAFPVGTAIAGGIIAGTAIRSGYDSHQNKKAYENMMQHAAASHQYAPQGGQQQPPRNLQHNQSLAPSSSPKLNHKGKNQQKGIT